MDRGYIIDHPNLDVHKELYKNCLKKNFNFTYYSHYTTDILCVHGLNLYSNLIFLSMGMVLRFGRPEWMDGLYIWTKMDRRWSKTPSFVWKLPNIRFQSNLY